MMTFIFFFAFVINTGMLVNAKINLQNAADLAAYAGASVQARQLTQISFLNYEMRRQWKKLLFRLYVVGNMAQDMFPHQPGQTGPMKYQPNASPPIVDYQVPTTCIIFNNQDDPCHLTELPKIAAPPHQYLDAITETLIAQIESIESIRKDNCKKMSNINLILNMFWLFNADPSISAQNLTSLSGDHQNIARVIQGLAYGLGIVPREMILRYRIRTLNDYVQAKANMGINKSGVDRLLNAVDPAANERTIQAFYSAYYTLGNHTFPEGSITLDELLPGNANGSNILLLKDIKTKFDTWGIVWTTDSDGCHARIAPISITHPLTVGVYKDPSILTYYAIRLNATARLMFSPFGDLEMHAYSAAQPFGSRIGPSAAEADFTSETTPNSGLLSTNGLGVTQMPTTAGAIPNLPVKKQDSPTPRNGWDTMDVVGTMFQGFAVNTGGGGAGTMPPTLSSEDMERAYATAMAPNPWESGRYNIMSDLEQDSFMRNFYTEPRTQRLIATFWAPVFAPDRISTAGREIQNTINAFFSADSMDGSQIVSQAAGAPGSNPIDSLQTTFQTQLTQYISNSLPQGNGESGESLNLVKITDPFRRIENGQPKLIGTDQTLFMNQAKDFKKSWNVVNDGGMQNEGRVGYSVKFVSFDSLTSHKLPSDGSTPWSNDLQLDGAAKLDVPLIKH